MSHEFDSANIIQIRVVFVRQHGQNMVILHTFSLARNVAFLSQIDSAVLRSRNEATGNLFRKYHRKIQSSRHVNCITHSVCVCVSISTRTLWRFIRQQSYNLSAAISADVCVFSFSSSVSIKSDDDFTRYVLQRAIFAT